MTTDLDALEAVLAKATQGPWSIWRERVADRAAAIAELAEQVNATEPMIDALILLNAGGKCPATTGCGPNSDNNASAIVALHNAAPALIAEHRALLARVEELEVILDAAVNAWDGLAQTQMAASEVGLDVAKSFSSRGYGLGLKLAMHEARAALELKP